MIRFSTRCSDRLRRAVAAQTLVASAVSRQPAGCARDDHYHLLVPAGQRRDAAATPQHHATTRRRPRPRPRHDDTTMRATTATASARGERSSHTRLALVSHLPAAQRDLSTHISPLLISRAFRTARCFVFVTNRARTSRVVGRRSRARSAVVFISHARRLHRPIAPTNRRLATSALVQRADRIARCAEPMNEARFWRSSLATWVR